MADPELAPPPSSDGISAPDIMNDPQYATNTMGGEDGMGDADTCRICRGEGSDTEPLFHPCKCSGSIKYVHQDCLMEWLSHSQKKHCELCKTAFRFTKLYSPNMPQSLPFHILLRHVAIHTAKNLATWLRFCLVVTVWLGLLPFVIRQVWRLLFWFSDGGWPSNYIAYGTTRNATSKEALEMLRELQQLATMTGNGTSPVSPLQASQTSSASVSGVMNKLTGLLRPVSQTLNITIPDPLAAGLFKSMLYGLGYQQASDNPVDNATVSQAFNSLTSPYRSPSLLSEVSFLRNLTRHAYVNQLVITVAEGYVITFVVVICFILVFLIREWVVQQQPGINMGAGFNAEFAAPERPRDQDALLGQQEVAAHQGPGANLLGNRPERREVGQHPRGHGRRRHLHVEGGAEHRRRHAEGTQTHDQEPVVEAGASNQRPSPVRDALAPAAEIQRQLEEPRMTEEFLAIWRRAKSDPEEVLRIIERENKGEQMRYWVNAMIVLRSAPEPSPPQGFIPAQPSQPTSQPGAHAGSVFNPDHLNSSGRGGSILVQPESDRSSASSDSWVDLSQPLASRDTNHLSANSRPEDRLGTSSHPLDKGKGKAQEPTSPVYSSTQDSEDMPASSQLPQKENYPDTHDHGHRIQQHPVSPDNPDPWSMVSSQKPFVASRPRAVSDGPKLRDTISPLANNNWTFSNLPDNNHDEITQIPREIQNENRPINHPQSPLDPAANNPLPHSSSQVQIRQDWNGVPEQHFVPEANEAEHPITRASTPDSDAEGPVTIIGLDGIERTHANWDAVFAANPMPADSDSDSDPEDEGPHPNASEFDMPLLEPREPVVVRQPEPQGILANVADFLWGGVGDVRPDDQGANDEHIVHDLAAEAPFVPVNNGPFEEGEDGGEQDREVVEAAIAAGIDPNDQDAIDDAEDFEGIMELVGMRGPIFSLIQNALFSAFLLALTVAFGAWIPYNIGRVSLLLLANPGPAFKLPLRLVFGCAALLQDLALSVAGVVSYCLIAILSMPITFWSYLTSSASPSLAVQGLSLGSAALSISRGALDRIMDGFVNSVVHIADSEIFAFSAASHESLITLQSLLVDSLTGLGSRVRYLFVGDSRVTVNGCLVLSIDAFNYLWHLAKGLPEFLARPDSWVISLELGKRKSPLDLELSVWSTADRFWATVAGYTAISVLGALYVKKGSPFSTRQIRREWEATIIDLLNQAGGVMKVILIISIEMLVFPLYCGLLLDAALLPLFENTTIMSRLLFTIESPLTSIFVHWFVGTCYMFHFALFVSMCRKIMRKGVLYFIRDPDDPTFHPVRDVLERNVATQLRKILFSALVYGGLVVICLGGVVWGLAYAFKGVLPIHWSSNEPVLEFPIDLLFYNFLMPLAVKFFKPSDGLHAMYTWWFRQCARMLRLTWFMFDERKEDEEGYQVRRTWGDIFRGAKGDTFLRYTQDDLSEPFILDPELKAYFYHDGRYVRAPASDQVRIPKNTSIFLEVDEFNERVDGKWDRPDGVHGKQSSLYKHVYIPPWFRVRIFLFILSIWLFAALTGVSITVVPLVFGRQVFAKIIPPHVRKNDVYAFSIGIYVLGSALYAFVHLGKFFTYIKAALTINANTPKNVLRQVTKISLRIGRIAWTYTAFLCILPTLFAFLVEFYFIVPLHTYFAAEERHVVHFVQSWTLGLLYLKLTTRIILWYEDSRPAQSLRAIIRDGYLNPNAWLATRSFILPVGLALCFALSMPWAMARVTVLTALKNNPEKHMLAYRYAYPMCLCLFCIGFAFYILLGWLKDWRMKIKDEVYLIGERLHNFGDRKATNGVSIPTSRRLET
ncbi:uncharacterized protein LY89DRAFT_683143 [Mollisia scopiformis]|uniref:RING-type E3 ubiquitin transferase n=1 Tax=Mollisia scopiformis TaxID=149040 RepID=A0A194XHH1_MOLSC|nr:uncharacterized protein LY89DRAFT_683143 [Mollisia scopiformis]KUJ19217.1 hypothetical protein LY89DRAFT_683143 [Mollisia scopiformis]